MAVEAQSLSWVARSTAGSSVTVDGLASGALALTNKMHSHQVFPLPTGSTADDIVETVAPAMFFHIHIVSDQVVIFRIRETIGGGEIDLEGKVLLLSAGQGTTGLNVLDVKVINLSGSDATIDVLYVKGLAE